MCFNVIFQYLQCKFGLEFCFLQILIQGDSIKFKRNYIFRLWMYLCRLLPYKWKYNEARIWSDKWDSEWVCRLDINISIFKIRRFRLREIKWYVQGHTVNLLSGPNNHACSTTPHWFVIFWHFWKNSIPWEGYEGKKLEMEHYERFLWLGDNEQTMHYSLIFLPPPTHLGKFGQRKNLFFVCSSNSADCPRKKGQIEKK